MYHYVMTVQSVWNREPKAAVTVSGTLSNPATREEAYAQSFEAAMVAWRQRYHGTSSGEMVVLFFSLERNELP